MASSTPDLLTNTLQKGDIPLVDGSSRFSGDPTKGVRSTIIAQLFQSVRYPILPEIILEKSQDPDRVDCYEEIICNRRDSLFAPGDFDVSPYFIVVRPTVLFDFDPRRLNWGDAPINDESVDCG